MFTTCCRQILKAELCSDSQKTQALNLRVIRETAQVSLSGYERHVHKYRTVPNASCVKLTMHSLCFFLSGPLCSNSSNTKTSEYFPADDRKGEAAVCCVQLVLQRNSVSASKTSTVAFCSVSFPLLSDSVKGALVGLNCCHQDFRGSPFSTQLSTLLRASMLTVHV